MDLFGRFKTEIESTGREWHRTFAAVAAGVITTLLAALDQALAYLLEAQSFLSQAAEWIGG